MVSAFDEIAENIRRGYSIGYVPTNSARDGGFRKVKVMVRMRDRKNLSVRSRDGYTAPGADGTRHREMVCHGLVVSSARRFSWYQATVFRSPSSRCTFGS